MPRAISAPVARTARPPLPALLALALLLALGPARPARAYGPWGPWRMGGITFDRGTNGCFGPVVGVYGEDALKGYILATAGDYCAAQLADGLDASDAIDVEWADGGTSCTGLDWAADNGDDNELAAAAVFATGCTGSFARSSSMLTGQAVGANVVEAITACQGATAPQGASPYPGTATSPCAGSALATGRCPANPTNSFADYSLDFPYPGDVSASSAQSLWKQDGTGVSDDGRLGGCPGETPFVQAIESGGGTRITWCDAIYGSYNDSLCSGNAVSGTDSADDASLLSSVCGDAYASPPAGPADWVGTIGQVSRASLLIDPRTPAAAAGGPAAAPPPGGCGLVRLAGYDAWNRACDPTTVTASSPYVAIDAAGSPTCVGDLQVADNNYPAWGYLHAYLNAQAATTGVNAEAQAYAAFLAGDAGAQGELPAAGFLRLCQLNWTRQVDGGPISPLGAAC